jgi:hypothetical protein
MNKDNIKMIDGIIHTLRNDEDLDSILKNGLFRGTNVSIDSRLPNQSWSGYGITLMYDKKSIRYNTKGYNPNEGIVLQHLNKTPTAILIGVDDFREDDYDLDDNKIEKYKERKKYLDNHASNILKNINKKLKNIESQISQLIYIEKIKNEDGEHFVFLYPKTRSGEYKAVLDVTNIKHCSIHDLDKILRNKNSDYIFNDTDIPKLLHIYSKIEEKKMSLDFEYKYLTNLNFEDIAKNKNKIDKNNALNYVKSLNLPKNIPIYYYTTNSNGTANIIPILKEKMSQYETLKLLENMQGDNIYTIVSGNGYIFDKKLEQIHQDDGTIYGELLDGQKIVKFENGQMVKLSDFKRDLLVYHKHTKLYGMKGEIKKDGLMPKIKVQIFPNFNYKSGYFPIQVIEDI